MTKKIQGHPEASTSTPPNSGPVTVARPAVAPQTPMAPPRSFGENVRIITDIVCGVTIAPPSPWKARAVMSAVEELARPHASDEAVKRASPMR